MYRNDTTLNAGLRKKLAEELGMTPSGMQVRLTGPVLCLCLVLTILWVQARFQSRSAKTQIRKAEQADALSAKTDGSVNGAQGGREQEGLHGEQRESADRSHRRQGEEAEGRRGGCDASA